MLSNSYSTTNMHRSVACSWLHSLTICSAFSKSENNLLFLFNIHTYREDDENSLRTADWRSLGGVCCCPSRRENSVWQHVSSSCSSHADYSADWWELKCEWILKHLHKHCPCWILLYSRIYIAPVNSRGPTEALLVRLAPRNETSFMKR